KAKSSKWLNETDLLTHRFEWQRGFGAFSYSHSQVDRVYKYIQNQEQHHTKEKFIEEYIKYLQAFNVDYDDRYLFDELI
ncbi:MAG: transposase, partial [Bacteroidota bacterium]